MLLDPRSDSAYGEANPGRRAAGGDALPHQTAVAVLPCPPYHSALDPPSVPARGGKKLLAVAASHGGGIEAQIPIYGGVPSHCFLSSFI